MIRPHPPQQTKTNKKSSSFPRDSRPPYQALPQIFCGYTTCCKTWGPGRRLTGASLLKSGDAQGIILDRMACGFALALAIGGRAAAADPLPGGKKTVIFEDCSMCIKHRKYRQKWPLGGVGLGLGGAKAKTAPPGGNWFFGDFLIIFDVAFFSVKIQARA